MAVTENRRSAAVPPPYKLCIKPTGRIVRLEYGTNLNNGVLKLEDGEVVIREGAKKLGWLLLEEAADSPEQLAAWQAFHEAERGGQTLKAPDEKFLPKVCRDRIAAAKAKQVFDFEAFQKKAKADAKSKGDSKAAG